MSLFVNEKGLFERHVFVWELIWNWKNGGQVPWNDEKALFFCASEFIVLVNDMRYAPKGIECYVNVECK